MSGSDTKESGIPWASRLPSCWDIGPLRSVLQPRGHTNLGRKTEQILSVLKDVGVVRYEERGEGGNKRSEDIEQYKIVHPGDIVMNRMNAIFGSLGISSHFGACSVEYYVLKPASEVDTRFYAYLFSTRLFQQSLLGIGRGILAHRMRIPFEALKQQLLPIPPLPVQRTIANFLDRKTAAIDALIEKKRKLVELLAEKRAALINQAVTKGLDPTVLMKDSGIPWIGEIPAHWEVAELRRFWTVVDCKHRTPAYIEEGYPVLSTTEVKPGKVDLSIATRFISEVDYLDMTGGGRNPSRGDVIYSRNASLGAAAYVETDEKFAMGQDVVLLRTDTAQNCDCLFLSHALNSALGMTQVDLACVGATFKRINVGQIRKLTIPIPPPSEQSKLATYLNRVETQMQCREATAAQSIARLQEYRQALITAAVTGQLDVPSGASHG